MCMIKLGLSLRRRSLPTVSPAVEMPRTTATNATPYTSINDVIVDLMLTASVMTFSKRIERQRWTRLQRKSEIFLQYMMLSYLMPVSGMLCTSLIGQLLILLVKPELVIVISLIIRC